MLTLDGRELLENAGSISKKVADQPAKEPGLSEDEIAFYDAVIQNDAAIMELGDETLKTIAKKLVTTVRNSKTIDWMQKESVRAKMRSRIRRLLAIYGYPPDKQESAIKLVIEQAEHMSVDEDA